MGSREQWILDLFCGAGGGTKGYQQAGFRVRGVDIKPQPRYLGEQFFQADALEYLAGLNKSGEIQEFAAIHASPPCQAFTKYQNAGNRRNLPSKYPDLVEPVRRLLIQSGLPYVIENVEGSPLSTYFVLCGSMFGLDVRRHRPFESSLFLFKPSACDHSAWPPNRFPGGRSRERGGARVLCRGTVEVGRWNIPLETQQRAMGIDWMTLEELSQSIPPAYTEFIGGQLLTAIEMSLND